MAVEDTLVYGLGVSWLGKSNISKAEREGTAKQLSEVIGQIDSHELEEYISRGIDSPLEVTIPEDLTVTYETEDRDNWPENVYRVKLSPIHVTTTDIQTKHFEIRIRICAGEETYHKILVCHEKGREPTLPSDKLVQYGNDIRTIQKSILEGFLDYIKDRPPIRGFFSNISSEGPDILFMSLPLHAEFLGEDAHDDILTLSDGEALFARYSLDPEFNDRYSEYLKFIFMDSSSDVKRLMEKYMEGIKEERIKIAPERNYVVYNNNGHSRPVAIGMRGSSRDYRMNFLGRWLAAT
ncbi:MAG: hypothetical protein V3U19_02210 [Thermodesulfobacteriota bacterium]